MTKKIKMILFVMITVISLTGCTQQIETEEEIPMEKVVTVAPSYDLNGDGVLTDSEYQTYIKRMSEGIDITTAEEFEDALNEASMIIGTWDTDEDGDLSYEESLSVMQYIYKKYDSGEITNENIRTILEGFERKVNELNSYYDLLEEVGVKGPKHKIELRPNE